MHSNLWEHDQTTSDAISATASTTATATTDGGGEQSPLTAAIEASSWSRADVELALQVTQVALLAVWVFLIYQNDD